MKKKLSRWVMEFLTFAAYATVAMELKNVFPEEAEAVIDLALESADFDLEKATTILRNSSNSKTPSPPPQRSFTTFVDSSISLLLIR